MTALFRPASVQGETAAYAPPVATIPPEALADHYARIVAAHGEELKRHRRRERGGHLFPSCMAAPPWPWRWRWPPCCR